MGESVLSRFVRIFEARTPEEPALTVSEISRRTGLHVATASRLVAECRRPAGTCDRRAAAPLYFRHPGCSGAAGCVPSGVRQG